MRTLLVGPDQEDNLSIRYLSGALRAAGLDAELAAFNGPDDVDAVVAAAEGYDLIGLSMCFQSRVREYLALARALKAAGHPLIIAGGHYATCVADELLTHHPDVDLVVLHEGEDAIVSLARGEPWAQIPGICYREEGAIQRTGPRRTRDDLDRLPFPDRRGKIHLFAGVPTAYLMGSRGCVATCDYCCIVTLHRTAPGKKFRRRDPACVADEMAELYHQRGIRQFIFHDDNFLVPVVEQNLKRIDAYAAAWEARGMRDIGFTIKCRPPDANPVVFRRLHELGLLRVFFGIESSSDEGLCSIGRKQEVAQSEAALQTCRELGISAQYTIMMFHPDATPETVRSDLDFLDRHIDHAANVCRTEIYAGTPLEARMIREGRARGDYLARTYRIADPRVELASAIFVRLFRERCWSTGGLMERVIGLDHLAAVAGRFCPPEAVGEAREAMRRWRVAANQDLVGLVREVTEAAFAAESAVDPRFLAQIRDIAARERASRQALLRQYADVRGLLDDATLATAGLGRERGQVVTLARPMGRLARHAAAALLAFTVAGSSGCAGKDGISEYAAPPLEDTDGDGLADECEESIFGTDPGSTDSDGDGTLDPFEDADGDGVDNLDEQGGPDVYSCPE